MYIQVGGGSQLGPFHWRTSVGTAADPCLSDPSQCGKAEGKLPRPLTASEVSLRGVAKANIQEQQVMCDHRHNLLRTLSPSYEILCIINSYPATCTASPPYAGKWPPTSA